MNKNTANCGGNEWLEADELGGFASGTASDIRTRRYHALLLTSATPPAGRIIAPGSSGVGRRESQAPEIKA